MVHRCYKTESLLEWWLPQNKDNHVSLPAPLVMGFLRKQRDVFLPEDNEY